MLDRQHQTGGKYDLSHFTYDADRDSFTCLEGHEMTLRTADPVRRIKHYSADTAQCKTCPIRKACTSAPARTVMRHMDEDARQIARDLSNTEKFAVSRRKRKKVEMNRPGFAGDQLVRITRPYRVCSSLHRMPPLPLRVGCSR